MGMYIIILCFSIHFANVKPLYLKFGNEEIRCTLIKKDRLPGKYLYNVFLKQYIIILSK
jgi:hypothetical protein